MSDDHRYYEIAGITVRVESDLPFTDTTFDRKFASFAVEGPGDDTVTIRHHFTLPDADTHAALLRGGEEVHRRKPWAIHRTPDGVYEGIAVEPGDPTLHRVSVFNADHSRGELYNPEHTTQW